MMSGLRLYINRTGPEITDSDRVFYSRRADGPYYLWRYERQQWRGVRVSSFDFSPKALCTTSWKVVPAALQRSMVDHYQE